MTGGPAGRDSFDRVESLDAAIARFERLGYRLDAVWPADGPHSAILSGPTGIRRISERDSWSQPSGALPPLAAETTVVHACQGGGIGRAGMVYRDLIPSRLGGFAIASHISVSDGPVADWVHYHRLVFQLIAVRRGWVRLVYEGQGEPFVMRAGDIVLQPPGIRHRVLEAGGNLEVVEISGPAEHETRADHDLGLPGGDGATERLFSGQRFALHTSAQAPWAQWSGGEAQMSGFAVASSGAVDALLVRPRAGRPITVAGAPGMHFGFVLDGSAELMLDQSGPVGPADAFVVAPGLGWQIERPSSDFRLLYVTARAA